MNALKNRYLIKIVPPVGYRVWRLEFSRRHIAVAAALVAITLGAVGGYYVWTIRHAEMRVGELRSLTADQSDRLQKIDAQAAELDGELRALEKQNDEIRKMFGSGSGGSAATPAKGAGPATKDARQSYRADGAFAAVAARVERLRADSQRVRADGDHLRGLAMRVLNVHRLEDLARARVLASIPSLNPAGNVGIRSRSDGGSIHGRNSTKASTWRPTTATRFVRRRPAPS